MKRSIQSKRKWGAFAAALGLIGAGIWLSSPRATPPEATARETPGTPRAEALELPRAAALALRREPEPAQEQVNLEESASLAKASVCRGELNFVSVHGAHSEDLAPDQTAYVRIADHSAPLQGTQVPFRLAATQHEAIRVVVETDGVISRELALSPPVVRDCEQPSRLELEVRQDLGSMDRPTFAVNVTGAGEADRPFELHRLEWDFGDGQTTETTAPSVQHSYESRVQSTRYSHYLVHVIAYDSDGRSMEGAASVVVANPAFRHLERDGAVRLIVSIEEDVTTDPPTQNFRLYHGYDADVSIDSVSMVETEYAGSSVPPVRAEAVDLVPGKVLGFTRIGVGETRQLGSLHELAANRPGVIRRFYLKGSAADGRPAFGRISLAPSKPVPN